MKYTSYLLTLIAVIIFILNIFDLYPIGKWGLAVGYILIFAAVFILQLSKRRKGHR